MSLSSLVVAAIYLFLDLSLPEIQGPSRKDWQAWAEIAADMATVLALLVGGVWTYWLYVRQRTRWPRAELNLLLTHRPLTEGRTLLHAKVKIHNAGRGLMKPSELRVDLHRVLPLSVESRTELEAGKDLLDEDGYEAEWPCIETSQRLWQDSQFEIEPGENEACDFDFFVSSDVETVSIYVYLDNRAKNKGVRAWVANLRKKAAQEKLGWGLTTIYDLVDASGTGSSSNLVEREGGMEEEKKRPQPDPRPPREGGLEEAQREPRPQPTVEKPADAGSGGDDAGDRDDNSKD